MLAVNHSSSWWSLRWSWLPFIHNHRTLAGVVGIGHHRCGPHHVPASARRGSRRCGRNRRLRGGGRRERERRRVVDRRWRGRAVVSRWQRGLGVLLRRRDDCPHRRRRQWRCSGVETPDPTLELFCDFGWSPDGERLVCEGYGVDDPSRDRIYSVRASDGGGLARITSNPDGGNPRRLFARSDPPLVHALRGRGSDGDVRRRHRRRRRWGR